MNNEPASSYSYRERSHLLEHRFLMFCAQAYVPIFLSKDKKKPIQVHCTGVFSRLQEAYFRRVSLRISD
jgi:hypothetical protein